jgi:hypothetical protein
MYLVKNNSKFTVYLEKQTYIGVDLLSIMSPGSTKYVDNLSGLRIRLPYGIGNAQAIEITNPYFNQLVKTEEVKEVLNGK